MKLLGDILQLTNQFLKQKGYTSHRRVSEQILSFVLGVDQLNLYMLYDRPLNEIEVAKAREILKKVVEGYPIEYVTGYVDFLDCRIEVDQRVLIPRPETEVMAHTVIQYMKPFLEEKIAVLDLCCGSGCLGLAIKKHCPNASVMLVDLSPDALAVAGQNAKNNQLEANLIQSDLLKETNGPFDVVVCNPPYISQDAYEKLDKSVKDWEPKMALCGGIRGTEFYEKLCLELPRVLSNKAKIFFEIGYDQADALLKIFSGDSFETVIRNDWAGHPRFVEIIYENVRVEAR